MFGSLLWPIISGFIDIPYFVLFITTPRAHARLEEYKYCSLQRCLIPLTDGLSREAGMKSRTMYCVELTIVTVFMSYL